MKRRRERERGRERDRNRDREKEREKAYGGIPSLPGHPRELPHFPFSSRVCPMLLRFRVGSGPTEPPSVSPPRAVLAATLPPQPLASPSPPLFRRLALSCLRGTGQVAAYGGCVYTYDARARARLHTPGPIDVYTPYTLSSNTAPSSSLFLRLFRPIPIPLVLNYARGTLHSFLSLGAARQLQQRNRTDLSLFLPLCLFLLQTRSISKCEPDP